MDTGAVVGVHDGFEYYTIGQKARISGVVHKYYVVGKRKNMIRGTTGDFVTSSDAKETKKSTGSGGVLKPSLHSELIMLQGKLDALNNTKEVGWKISGDVYVVNDINHIALNSPYITQPLSAINWIAGCAPLELLDTLQRDSLSGTSTEQQPPLPRSYRCECKVRYLQLPTQCSIQLYKGAPYSSAHRMNPAGNHRNTTGSGSVDQQQQEQEEIMMKITFDIPQRAITPGQIIALYDGEVVLGGGVIAEQPLPEGK